MSRYIHAIANVRATLEPEVLDTFDSLVSLSGAEKLIDQDPQGRVDAQTLPFLARALEHVMAETYDEQFPEMFVEQGLLPIDRSVPEGARTFIYFLYSAMGIARFATNYSSGTMPVVTMEGAMVSGNVQFMEGAYAYTVRDIRAARQANLPLESYLAIAEKRAHLQLLNKTTLWGREDLGLPGLFNHPNITITDAPDGAGASPLWADKTPDEIIADVALLLSTIEDLTFGIEKPNTILMAPAQYNQLRLTRMGAGDGSLTILNHLKEIYKDDGLEFRKVHELDSDNSDGNLSSNSLFAFTAKDPRKVSLVVPMPFKQHGVEQRELNFIVCCESSTGGIKMPAPLSAHRLDGVG